MWGGKKRGEGGNKEIAIPWLHDTFSYTKEEAGTWDILQGRGGNWCQWSFKHDCGTLGIKEKAEGQRK